MAFVSSVPLTVAASSASAFVCAKPSAKPVVARRATFVMMADSLQQRIAAEMKKAQEATEKFGKGSKEAAVAWDAVEELEAEASHQKNKASADPLEKYCEETPEADECKTYE